MEPGNTVVFFDEIQECPNARTAIKFLVEDGRFDYMESGSLLGVNYKHVPSMPVGFETVVHMYPMDFEEFCLANGVPENTFHYLRECYETKTQVTPAVHETMLELFRYYVVVGGMPAAVQTFVDTRDIGQVMTEQKNILALYRKDIGQYTSEDERVKVTDIFDRIPSQLDDKNRRFVLSSISSNARQRDHLRGVGVPHRAGAAGQDHTPDGSVQGRNLVIRINFTINVELAEAASDELGHLGAEIKDQDLIHRGNS